MITMRKTLMTFAVLAFLSAPPGIGAGEIAESANDIQPVGTGDKMPAATVKTVEGEDFNLADAVTEKPAVLIFYRGGW
jgi:hypothetical protein